MSAAEWTALALSLRVALVSVAIGLPLAIVVSWLLARRRFPGRLLLDALVHLPLVLPPVVVGYALLVLLGRRGPLGSFLHDQFGIALAFSWQGAAVAAAVMGFPLAVRSIRLSWDSLDPGLIVAARSLGAGPVKVFFTVTLPLIAPGIAAGGILAFARALGEFGATLAFVANIPGETQTLPLALYAALQQPGGEAVALRLALVSAVLAVGAVLMSDWMARRLPAARPHA